MANVELKQARTVALDPKPDLRGNLSIIVRLDDGRATALAANVN